MPSQQYFWGCLSVFLTSFIFFSYYDYKFHIQHLELCFLVARFSFAFHHTWSCDKDEWPCYKNVWSCDNYVCLCDHMLTHILLYISYQNSWPVFVLCHSAENSHKSTCLKTCSIKLLQQVPFSIKEVIRDLIVHRYMCIMINIGSFLV